MTNVDVVLMRNSERAKFRRCMLAWDWSYNRRLAPPRSKGALTFGTMIHDALEIRYPPGRKRGPHPAGTFAKLFDAQSETFDQWDEEGNRVPARELGIAMLEGYVELYGEDEDIEILQPEIPMQVDVYDRHENYLCTWVGKGDAAYKYLPTGRKGFLEHKTAKSIPEEVMVISGYGDQGIAYFWASDFVFRQRGWLEDGEYLDHVKYNWLRKALQDDRPKNADGLALNKPKKEALLDAVVERGLNPPRRATVEALTAILEREGVEVALLGEISKIQPKPLFHRFTMDLFPGQMNNFNERIRQEAWLMRQARAGRIPILKNPTKDCSWDCEFKDACELHSMGGDFEASLELEFGTWDPYSDHEIFEEKL